VKSPQPRAFAPGAPVARFTAALLLAAAASGIVRAQDAPQDPLASSECTAARDELESVLNEAARAGRQAPAAQLARARQHAALACLGRESGNRERAGAPQPAQAVAPPAIPANPAPAPVITSPPPPVDIPRPSTVTNCDAAGCWDSEGKRLNNLGPLLVGPRGLCTMQGGLLNCPSTSR